MKWDDTIKACSSPLCCMGCHEHQAEISFSAGETVGYNSGFIAGREHGKQVGRKEVVRWVESLPDAPTYSICEESNIKIPEPPSRLVIMKVWQQQKEEWGL